MVAQIGETVTARNGRTGVLWGKRQTADGTFVQIGSQDAEWLAFDEEPNAPAPDASAPPAATTPPPPAAIVPPAKAAKAAPPPAAG